MLQRYASTRPNMQIETIPNSGWPSLPRNLGTHGLVTICVVHGQTIASRCAEAAGGVCGGDGRQHRQPEGVKTTDVWWGILSLTDGNIPDVALNSGINRLLPMVPHKVYRRDFMLEQSVSFPEGRRQLSEDIYVNVEAYRKARKVAVLADTPAYLWHSSTTNNSKTYGPGSVSIGTGSTN